MSFIFIIPRTSFCFSLKTTNLEYLSSLNIDDVNEALNLNLESEEYNSIGGYIIEKLELFPKAGDKYEQEGIYLEVLEVINNRIEKVKLKIFEIDKNEEQPEE